MMGPKEVFDKLYKHSGHQHWWPVRSRNPEFEIIIGAILTQNTSWKNVEKAIENLERENKLSPQLLNKTSDKEIERLIKPAGFFKVKRKRVKNFLDFLFKKYDGKVEHLLELPTDKLREELLSVNGIGNETADSIILYAAKRMKFVVDAYTIRLFNRLGLIITKDYDEVQRFFESNLPKDVKLFNEYHALIVEEGKNICRPKPKCRACPLNDGCDYYKRK